ncbi:hypothetical protein T439DRAFT_321844 [Meredithblackwellia eburnea MCA 4105]
MVHLSSSPPLKSTHPQSMATILGGRFRIQHVFAIIGLYSIYLFVISPSTSRPPPPTSMSFCPYSSPRRHIPTVILQAEGHSERTINRTHWVGGREPASFLPYSYPPRDLRVAQTTSSSSPGAQGGNPYHNRGKGNLGGGVHGGQGLEDGKQLCEIHRVPSSPPPAIPKDWKNNKVMFGMSTTPDRVLYSLPVWSHWLPASPQALDPSTPAVKDLPLVLVLTPPPNPTEEARTREAMDEAQGIGMYIEMRPREADRFETRYFALVEEMWREAQKREAEHGIKTEWFVFADDDTFYPDFHSLVRMLASFDSESDRLIGALSESTKQVAQWGHIAYGGAGIYLSRALMAKINQPGHWQTCLEKYGGAFGGDAMVSACAALALDKTMPEIITLDDTLHQLDIRGDGTGWFQSGFLITSLHHWASWFSLFPPWHESGNGDLRKGITLVGKASKAIGGDNWGRRYIFEDGKVVISLGYSIAVHANPVTEEELDQSEHTWWEFATFHPNRPGLVESVDKRTYYLTGVRILDSQGVARLEHKNREGERIDIIYDRRGEQKGGWLSGVASANFQRQA